MRNYLSAVIRLLMFLSGLLPVVSQACWSLEERKEIEGFSELDDVLILSFKDALNCASVYDARVQIGELEYFTDNLGYARLPLAPFAAQMDSTLTITVTRKGYVPLTTDLIIQSGIVLNRKLVMTPALSEGKVRFVLQWNDEPMDLDLHLKGPDFHISYRNMKDAPNRAKLDRDELEGYGPETITLDRILSDANYSVWVDNYSGDGKFQGSERVYVYSGEQLLKEIRLHSTGQRGVKIMEITGGSFHYINSPSVRP